jgi:hypothetical protein
MRFANLKSSSRFNNSCSNWRWIIFFSPNIITSSQSISCISYIDNLYDQIREYRELYTEYAELIDEIEALDEKELSDQSFDKLKRLVTLIISETEKFYYLAGLHDARQVLEGS